MSGDHAAPAQVRARLLARLNHELRAPLARIVAQAGTLAGGAALAASARQQLAWLADLQQCARCEVQPPELTPAPAYLHALLQAHGVDYDTGALAPLAVLDARMLGQVLAQLAHPSSSPPSPPAIARGGQALRLVATAGAADAAGAAEIALSFQAGVAAAQPWSAVPMSLDHDAIEPGLMLAAHRVAAMGGRLERAGAALRFTVTAPLAVEHEAAPPPLRDLATSAWGDGYSVLLCEPHEAMCAYLAEVFDSAGYSVLDAAAAPGVATPSLVVCASAALAAEAARRWPAPQLLHVLAPADAAMAGTHAPALPLLYKPAPPQQLLAAARQLLERPGDD